MPTVTERASTAKPKNKMFAVKLPAGPDGKTIQICTVFLDKGLDADVQARINAEGLQAMIADGEVIEIVKQVKDTSALDKYITTPASE